jgi:hypothetical protein
MSNRFGTLAGGDQVDAALLSVLNQWMPTYLRAVCEDREIDLLDAPRSITVASEFARFPEAQLPAIVVVNGGTETPTERPGHYDARWPVQVCVECQAAKQTETRRNAAIYLIAARESLLRRRSLGAGFKGLDWGGESYTLRDVEDRRSIAGATATFTLEREAVAQIGGGPSEPDQAPYPDWPTVSATEITVEKTN